MAGLFLRCRGVLASKNERVVALKARAGQAREELQDNTLQLSSIEDDLTKIETLLQVNLLDSACM